MMNQKSAAQRLLRAAKGRVTNTGYRNHLDLGIEVVANS